MIATENPNKLEAYEKNGELDICVTLDVDEWLDERVEENEELQDEFDKWREDNDKDDRWDSALEFAIDVKHGKGIYGDGKPFCVNTYNEDDLLSSILQFVYWEDDDGPHVLLEKHMGGDARGNYAPIVAMDCIDDDGTGIFDNAKAAIYCDNCDASWSTDDGDYHWYPGCYSKDYVNLESYPATDTRPEYPAKPDPNQRLLFGDTSDYKRGDSGVVFVDDDNNAYCPHCGGLLQVSSF